MVAQIGLVSSDIRAHIEKIEAFSLLRLESNEPVTTTAATGKRESCVRFVMPRRSTIAIEEAALVAATTPADATVNRHKSDAGVNVTFAEDATLPIREYFHSVDQQRNEKVRKIKELFESIGPILIKLESLILGTFTGESSKMKLCYAYWEKELFKLLIRYAV